MIDVWEDWAVLPAHGAANPGRYAITGGDCAIGTKIYAVGGFDQTLAMTQWNDIYDSDTDTWSSGAVYPLGSSPFGVVDAGGGVIGGKLYVVGGVIFDPGSQVTAKGEVYDPGADSWTAIANATAARSEHGAAVHGGYLYVIGGVNTIGVRQSTLYRYDPGADSWATLTSMSVALRRCNAATIGDYIYVAGGNDSSGNDVATLYRYDINADSWSTMTSMPAARAGNATAAINGKLYVAGGSNASPSVASNYEYDPGTDTWATKTAPSVGRVRGAWGVIGGQYLHWIGGFRATNDFRDEHQRYVVFDLAGWTITGQIV